MQTFILSKADVPSWVRGLLAAYRVVGPTEASEGVVHYTPLAEAGAAVLDGLRPIRSPKEYFIPATEPLLTYRGSGASLVLEPPAAPARDTVILGVRPCDARALTRLDDVFLRRKETDGLYEGQRKRTRLVGLACEAPSWGCFCTSVGGSPAGTEGLDLALTDLGDRFHLAVLTEAGRALLSGAGFAGATEADDAEAEARHRAAASRMPPRFDGEHVADKIDWEAPFWAHYAKRCLACGACSFLCPTCHCFDIQDEVKAADGKRVRNWDSCMFPLFTKETSGHNPRPSQKERWRQRFMHKFRYYVDMFGPIACVGCGRCVMSCPVNIDIRKIVADISKL